jgi:hypothetical protein
LLEDHCGPGSSTAAEQITVSAINDELRADLKRSGVAID